MKIPPDETDLFHADGQKDKRLDRRTDRQTDRHDEANNHSSEFCERT